MSQVINDANLEKLISSFRASVIEKNSLDDINEYLIEDDCDEYVDLGEDEENTEFKLTSLNKIFLTYLKDVTLDQLGDLFYKSSDLIVYLYARIKYLAQKITINNEDEEEAKKLLLDMLHYIELAHEKIDSFNDGLHFECFASFFIVTLKISYILFTMIKQTAPISDQLASQTSVSLSQQPHRTAFISSQITTSIGSNRFNLEISNRINSILIKQANIIDKKIQNLNENKRLQIKYIYFLSNLLGDYLSEAKTMAFVWKLVSKIVIKNRLFIGTNEDEILIKSKHDTSTCSIKFIFNKFFYCIYNVSYNHFIRVKRDLLKLSSPGDKLLKYNVFLFKILKTIILIYNTWLVDTEAFYLLTNILSTIAMITHQIDFDTNSTKIKLEFSKEVSIWADEIIGEYNENEHYLTYLSEHSLTHFEKVKRELMNKFVQVYKITNTENYYDQVEYYEELCLFYSIIINRTSNQTDWQLVVKQIDNLMQFTNICTRACNLPLELISFELSRYDLAKINEFKLNECLRIEFFDLILFNLFNYVMLNLKLNKFILTYLITNLLVVELKTQSIKIYICNDLFLLVTKKLLNSKLCDPCKLFQFLFETYECNVINTSVCFALYESSLIELVRFYLNRFDAMCILKLVDYLREQKYFTSFNLIMSLNLKQLSSRVNDYSTSKVIDYFSGFYGDLSNFLTQSAKTIDQNLLKKLITFIKNKNGLQVIKWVSFNSNNLTLQLVESACKCLNNFFLKLDFVDTFLKLYESFILITVETASNQSVQIYANFQYVFQFIFNSIRLWSDLAHQSNDSDKLVLLEFLQRCINKQIDSTNSQFTSILLNFKYLTVYSLMLILNKEINDTNLRKKLNDLVFNLVDDTSGVMRNLLSKCLGDLASCAHINSRLVVEMVRSNKTVRDIVSNNNSELNFSDDKTLDMILIENNKQIFDELKRKQEEEKENQMRPSQNNLDEITFDIGKASSLDDTMNAIFAMDTTISMDVSNSQAFKAKNEKLIELVEENLNELIENYIQSDKPRWLKEKLNLMFKTYSDKL